MIAALKHHVKMKHGLQKRAARYYGISESMLTKVIRGTAKPPQKLLYRLEIEGFDLIHFAPTFNLQMPDHIENHQEFKDIIATCMRLVVHYEAMYSGSLMMITNLNNIIDELRQNNKLIWKEREEILEQLQFKKLKEISA